MKMKRKRKIKYNLIFATLTGLQFAAEMTRELNWILGIETKLLTFLHLQIDGQTEQINQELE